MKECYVLIQYYGVHEVYVMRTKDYDKVMKKFEEVKSHPDLKYAQVLNSSAMHKGYYVMVDYYRDEQY